MWLNPALRKIVEMSVRLEKGRLGDHNQSIKTPEVREGRGQSQTIFGGAQ